MLRSLEVPFEVMERPLPDEIKVWVHEARERVQAFQDRWDRPQIEQFVASDYELVYQTLEWIRQQGLSDGSRFLEWGCGFSVVCALASYLGWDVVGIEAEAELLAQGRQTLSNWKQPVELCHGNFLPAGAEELADDPTLPSLGHPVGEAYQTLGLDVDDFSVIFAYPWPGEEGFLLDVFEKYATAGMLFLQYCGPFDLRLWRHLGHKRK